MNINTKVRPFDIPDDAVGNVLIHSFIAAPREDPVHVQVKTGESAVNRADAQRIQRRVNIDGSAKQLSNFVDFKTIAVKSNTAFPLCAQQLAVYFANADASLTRFTNQGDVPILKSLAESDAIKNDFVAAALNDQAALATNQPSIPQMGSYWDPMKAFGDGVYYGEINKTNLQSSLDSLVDNICSTLTN